MKRLLEQRRNNSRVKNKGSNLPFEISLQSLSEVDKHQRRQNTERVKEFNDAVATWSKQVTQRLKISVKSMVTRDHVLSKSIRPNLYYDRKYAKEVNRVGFSFAREGIYIHRGAGRGQGGIHGSKWYNLRGELKTTNLSSLMKMGTGNRTPKEWFNPVIEQELPKLADIVSEYSASLQIDSTSIYIN